MGVMKEKYIENQIKKEHGIFDVYVDKIAEKVANEPIDDELEKWIIGETEDGHMPLVKKKQTKEEMFMPDSEEEFQADLAADDMRYHHYCLEQQEMYNDPYLNWSGLR